MRRLVVGGATVLAGATGPGVWKPSMACCRASSWEKAAGFCIRETSCCCSSPDSCCHPGSFETKSADGGDPLGTRCMSNTGGLPTDALVPLRLQCHSEQLLKLQIRSGCGLLRVQPQGHKMNDRLPTVRAATETEALKSSAAK